MEEQKERLRERDELGGRAEPLWTVHQLAVYLRMSDKGVYALSAKGDIPTLRAGNKLRFDPREINAWLRKGSPGY
jgi:excisionase family DNA binding protein